MTAYTPGSAVLWTGPSAIDGAPIVVIATGFWRESANRKTGAMAQLWILRSDVAPVEAVRSGADESTCGDCPLAAAAAATCYVHDQIRAARGPATVYRTFVAGRYRQATADDVSVLLSWPHGIRWGAYGDPLAVPVDALRHDPILAPLTHAPRRTGYTHRWRWLTRAEGSWAQQWLMASVDTDVDARDAVALGWRYFRPRAPGSAVRAGERECPASRLAGYLLTCDRCRACDGTERGARRPHVSIEVHGSAARRSAALA